MCLRHLPSLTQMNNVLLDLVTLLFGWGHMLRAVVGVVLGFGSLTSFRIAIHCAAFSPHTQSFGKSAQLFAIELLPKSPATATPSPCSSATEASWTAPVSKCRMTIKVLAAPP